MHRNNNNIEQIANSGAADNDNTEYLSSSDYPEFNQKYKVGYFPNSKKWISFTPKNRNLMETVKKNNNNLFTGYKIHIAIPKNADYKKHVRHVISILSQYEFYFKIDADLNNEPLGERAFTVYLPHKFHAYWFQALKQIEDYLGKQLECNKKPKTYSSDGTAKNVASFNYVFYRNDREENGQYTKNRFNDRYEHSLANPFRPRVINLLNKIYSDDARIYRMIANHMQHDIAYGEFLIYLWEKNQKNLFDLLEPLTKNSYLRHVISNLCWHDLMHNEAGGFAIAENLVKDKKNRDTILNHLKNASSCPAYHAATQKLKEYSTQPLQPSLKKEVNDIVKTIEAVTVKTLHTTLIKKRPCNEDKAKQKIYREIDARLTYNDNLTVKKSNEKCIKNVLLNILYFFPVIGWAAGIYHYVEKGSFFHSLSKKSKPQKEIERDMIAATSKGVLGSERSAL